MTTLYKLIERVKKDDEKAVEELLQRISPKVKSAAQAACASEREDIKQELNVKIVQAAKKFSFEYTPGFWETVLKEGQQKQ
ncbi:helix-turn-helix domain-containing protein [Priestia flexa]|uniref:helix-turn-helix domain-containing protein n=1 Tax=Priestia flexa TaxID=86664 RepID=UPI00119E6A59|nr:helix-turn-helix domain-containing protein [Priestia flexa]